MKEEKPYIRKEKTKKEALRDLRKCLDSNLRWGYKIEQTGKRHFLITVNTLSEWDKAHTLMNSIDLYPFLFDTTSK